MNSFNLKFRNKPAENRILIACVVLVYTSWLRALIMSVSIKIVKKSSQSVHRRYLTVTELLVK